MREQIWLKKNQKYGELYYMTEDLLEETLALRNYVRDQMTNQRWFAPSGREDFEAVLRWFWIALPCGGESDRFFAVSLRECGIRP